MIKDLGELEKFLKLCRKQGVKDIKFGECSVVFGEVPRKPRKGDDEDPEMPDEMTPEQLMFFSAGGGAPPP